MNIESGIAQPPKNIPEKKGKIEWGIYPKRDTIERVVELQGALKSNDGETARKIIRDPKALHSLLEGGKYNELEMGFNMLIAEKFGPGKNIFNVAGEKIVEMVHEHDIPEQFLVEILSAEFHKKDSVAFNRMITIILENKEFIRNQEIISGAKHISASWQSSNEHNSVEAIEKNKKVIREARENEDVVLATKASFGLTFNKKDLSPSKKIKDYQNLAHILDESGKNKDLQYLILRFKLEEARERIKLADRQKGGDKKSKPQIDRMENLIEAKRLCDEILDAAGSSVEYPKLRSGAAEISQKAGILRSRELSKK